MKKHALKTWSEYMNMHAVYTCKKWLRIDAHVYYKFVIKETHYSVQWWVHMMRSMRMNTCMQTMHGNISWNNSRSVVVDDAHNIMLVIVCTENME